MPIILDRAVMHRQGGPRNTDWQASDADAIGIYPVPVEGTVVDGSAGRTSNDPNRSPNRGAIECAMDKAFHASNGKNGGPRHV
jgi:hypothetical protein